MADSDSLIAIYEGEGIKQVKLAFVDVDGVMRGKYCLLYTSPSPRDRG